MAQGRRWLRSVDATNREHYTNAIEDVHPHDRFGGHGWPLRFNNLCLRCCKAVQIADHGIAFARGQNRISAETLARRSSDRDFDSEHGLQVRGRRRFGQTRVHDDITDSLIQLSERHQGGFVEARTVFQPRILASRAEGEDGIWSVSIVPGSGSWNDALGGGTDTSDDENEAQSDDRSQHGFRHPMEHALQDGGPVHTGLQFQFAANLNHAFGIAHRDFARLQQQGWHQSGNHTQHGVFSQLRAARWVSGAPGDGYWTDAPQDEDARDPLPPSSHSEPTAGTVLHTVVEQLAEFDRFARPELLNLQ